MLPRARPGRELALRSAALWAGLALGALGAMVALGCGRAAPGEAGPAPAGLPGGCAPGETPDLVVRGGRLFDGSGAPPLPDAVVIVRAGRIAAAGPAAALPPPRCARQLDAAGGTILPGIVDSHVHLAPLLARGGDPLTAWLRAGVTTLVDNGSALGAAGLRQRVAQAARTPPRVLCAGRIVTAPGGYPLFDRPAAGSESLPVADPADARRRVAEMLDRERPDLVKAAIERGFLADLADPGWPVPAPATLAAVAAEAHARGLTARAHVTQAEELRAALDAGFDAAAHTPVEELPDELLERAARQGLILVSTAALWRDDPALAAAVGRNLARYVQKGGRAALGTDAPFGPSGGLPFAEMQALAAAGLAPRDVLLAATRHGAEAAGRGRELGRIAAGYRADLLVVDGDPLADLQALRRVRIVVLDGAVIVPEERR